MKEDFIEQKCKVQFQLGIYDETEDEIEKLLQNELFEEYRRKVSLYPILMQCYIKQNKVRSCEELFEKQLRDIWENFEFVTQVKMASLYIEALNQ